MKLHNQHGLPDYIVETIDKVSNEYSAGISDYTPSSLNSPMQIRYLMKKHHKELEGDVSEKLASFIGTSVHDKFEAVLKQNPRYIVEQRNYRVLTMPDGTTRIIGAQLDLYDRESNALIDHKITSVYKLTKQDASNDPDWVGQIGVNAWIMRDRSIEENGKLVKVDDLAVDEGYISGVAKDWRRGESLRNPAYPRTPIVTIPIEIMGEDEAEQWIIKRVLEHESETLHECTEEDRWADKPSWAVLKKGGKRAVSGGIHETQEAAIDHANTLTSAAKKAKKKDTFIVQKREGDMWRRCEGWCPVQKWCPQYARKSKKDNQKVLGEFDL